MKHRIDVPIGAFMALSSLWGCGSPTAPDDPSPHPNEILINEYTQCYGGYHGLGRIDVSFSEESRMVPCQPGSGKECVAAGWAWPSTRQVTYYRPWVRDECPRELCPGPTTREQLKEAAAHETCHLAGNPSEPSAIGCLHETLEKHSCP